MQKDEWGRVQKDEWGHVQKEGCISDGKLINFLYFFIKIQEMMDYFYKK